MLKILAIAAGLTVQRLASVWLRQFITPAPQATATPGVCQPVATPDGVVVGAVGTAGSVVGGVVDAAAAIAGGVVNAARSIISPRVNAVTGKPTVPRHQARILTLATAPERLEVIPTAPDELFPVLLAPGALAANRWEPDEVPYGLLGAVASNSLNRAPHRRLVLPRPLKGDPSFRIRQITDQQRYEGALSVMAPLRDTLRVAREPKIPIDLTAGRG